MSDVPLHDVPPAERVIHKPEQRERRVWWEVAAIRDAGRRGILLCTYDRAFARARDERISRAVECR